MERAQRTPTAFSAPARRQLDNLLRGVDGAPALIVRLEAWATAFVRFRGQRFTRPGLLHLLRTIVATLRGLRALKRSPATYWHLVNHLERPSNVHQVDELIVQLERMKAALEASIDDAPRARRGRPRKQLRRWFVQEIAAELASAKPSRTRLIIAKALKSGDAALDVEECVRVVLTDVGEAPSDYRDLAVVARESFERARDLAEISEANRCL